MNTKVWLESVKERGHLQVLGIDGSIVVRLCDARVG
jgi:hypothetical protein